jgi:Rad3-related DNA helicase
VEDIPFTNAATLLGVAYQDIDNYRIKKKKKKKKKKNSNKYNLFFLISTINRNQNELQRREEDH